MKRLLGVVMLFLLLSFTGKALAEKILAEVGPYRLTESELARIIEEDPRLKEILKANPQLKPQIEKGVLERWVNIAILALAAKEENLSEDPLIKSKLLEAEKMILAEAYLQKKISKVSLSEEELKSYYEKHKDQYKEPEGLKLKHILIYVPKDADQKTREKALTRAKQIRAQLLKGAKFEELAKIHSDDTASREKGGDLGILRKGETLPEFEKEVFKLKPGELSQPIASPYGYHLVKVEKKLPEEVLPYEKVKDQVKQDLLREKEGEEMQRLMKELTQRYQPKLNLEKTSGER